MAESFEEEKNAAKENIITWLNEAEEKADELWNKNQDQVRLYFKGNDERKPIGIFPQEDSALSSVWIRQSPSKETPQWLSLSGNKINLWKR